MSSSPQRNLYHDEAPHDQTEGVKYAGSKLKIIKYILPEVKRLGVRHVLDGFAGTTRVSQALARMGLSVSVNDKALLSKIFGQCYLLTPPNSVVVSDKIRYLNGLKGSAGWYTEHYGGEECAPVDHLGNRKPWQRHNTERLDVIRPEIDRISTDEVEKAALLTSLILAMDSVDSTLGHYAAYLSKWSSRSFRSFQMKMPNTVGVVEGQYHNFYCGDVEDCIKGQTFDLCYFDPPYGSNNDKMPPSRVRYSGYYHIWKTIILNDRPELFGRVNRRQDSRDVLDYSVYEDFRRSQSGQFRCVEAIGNLVRIANTRFIMLSYSSGGRATFEGLTAMLASHGSIIKVLKIDHARHVMSSMTSTGSWARDEVGPHHEFLFVLEKA